MLIGNCEILISFLDILEERWRLSLLEFRLRSLIKSSLSRPCEQRAAYWRQHSKVRQCILGDENTAYHYQCATIRLQRNKIKSLSHDGIPVTSHSGKEHILLSFFSNLLGVVDPVNLDLDLSTLLLPFSLDSFQADSLVHPFEESELRLAILGMNSNASPGPDGFGPAFYRSCWDLVKHNILSLAADFHSTQADLTHFNKSYITLIPKKT